MDGFNSYFGKNNTDDLSEMLDNFDMTLTGKVRFFSFALIVITFSLKDGFNSYLDKTTLNRSQHKPMN